jgi:hypothetical protein
MLQHNLDCSNGLLQTDIGLIAVNETHAVFSVCVPRAMLAQNHFFLNVLSDVAGGDGRLQLPARPVPPAPKSKWRKAAAVCAAVARAVALQ